jgi:hypothetical protein
MRRLKDRIRKMDHPRRHHHEVEVGHPDQRTSQKRRHRHVKAFEDMFNTFSVSLMARVH